MSTYQPPGEPPSYAAPQDPWANAQGVTSAPTDPIPQQQPHGQFTPGVASPSVWTQETISHGDYEYVAQQRSRLGTYILVVLAVIVLGGGGGYGAYYLITTNGIGQPSGQGTNPSTHTSTGTVTSSTSTKPQAVDPATLKVGDCIFNTTPDDPATPDVTEPTMVKVACGTAQSYKILKIASGESIPEGPNGSFGETTWDQVCAGTNPARKVWFGWDSSDDKNDFFFCLSNN